MWGEIALWAVLAFFALACGAGFAAQRFWLNELAESVDMLRTGQSAHIRTHIEAGRAELTSKTRPGITGERDE